MQVCRKVTVRVTIHDLMVDLRPNGVGGRNLRQILWGRFLKIYCQSRINGLNVGGRVKFKFNRQYKLQVAIQQTTLGKLKIELLCAPVFMN